MLGVKVRRPPEEVRVGGEQSVELVEARGIELAF